MYLCKMMEYREIIMFVSILLIITSNRGMEACRVGTGGHFPRRSSKPIVPLVYKQHIPNISETTIGASGPAEGKITRSDKRFKNLVECYNEDIVFKNEENTDADRKMTPRCRDRLMTLALLVRREWPEVKLRVTEAWDEEGVHERDSLHYEGRAVDITTDDKDRRKYGALARLAVRAGFDWVYYESEHHIHASVIAESSVGNSEQNSGCFPGESIVTMEHGEERKVADLKVGDTVLTVDRLTGETISSDVILIMHKNVESVAEFLTITAEKGTGASYLQRSITLTPNHLIYIHAESQEPDRWKPRAIFAENVKIGDKVYIKNSNGDNTTDFSYAKVTNIEKVMQRGVYAPLTTAGSLIVDGIAASSYAVFEHENIAHALFYPLRVLWSRGYRWLDYSRTMVDISGVHWYPKSIYNIASAILPAGVLNL